MRNYERWIGNGSMARRPADSVNTRIAVTTNEQITVPDRATHVILTGNLLFYVAFGADPTAAVPGADVTDGTGSAMIYPGTPIESRTFIVDPGSKIGLVAPVAAIITAEFYGT